MTTTVTSEPLTYHRHAPHSYFRDLILDSVPGRRPPGTAERLQRHRQEMEVIIKERDKRAWGSLWEGEVEYRVEPNRTDGTGGYFSPPIWLNELFAPAKRAGRVLAGLMSKFDLPSGISQVNLPIIGTGTTTAPVADTAALPDSDLTDTAGSSTVVTITGQEDLALQMLEQSPSPASIDWAISVDLTESQDSDLESQLLTGTGSTSNQLLGVLNVVGGISVTFTSASPTGALMFPVFGEMSAQLGDARLRPPEAWLFRTARWSWLQTQEDTGGRPFGISTPFFLGSDDDTPDPSGGLLSWPVFLDDALPATLGAAGNQDTVVCLRPTDLVLFESQPQVAIIRDPLSGILGARVQLHSRFAAITSRYPSGICQIGGSGFAIQSGY